MGTNAILPGKMVSVTYSYPSGVLPWDKEEEEDEQSQQGESPYI